MPTVINNPTNSDTGTGNGVVIGILLVVFLAILFLIFGLPYLRNRGTANPAGTNINVTLPSGDNSANGGASGGAAPAY
jgi:UPF0716 family protein affecting phage T7 exclusion